MRASFIMELVFGRTGVVVAFISLAATLGFAASGRYGWSAACALGFAACLLSLKRVVQEERRAIRALIEELRRLESLSFEAACAKVGESSVPVAGQLARMREFSSPAPQARHRYFERDEVVFRVEESLDGTARFVFQKLKHA